VSGQGEFLDMVTAGEPQDGSWLEFRWKTPRGMGRAFAPSRAHRAARSLIEARGRETDLYVGVAPRSRQEGTAAAVDHVHVLWADLDDEAASEALAGFEPRPSMIVDSGGGRHAYWALAEPLPARWAKQANRRIARELGADMRATDATRILRPPSTLSYKYGEPRPVTVEHLEPVIYATAEIVGDLPDSEPEQRPQDRRTAIGDRDLLLTIAPAVYIEALTGQIVGRDGKAHCVFHSDSTPSLHVYDNPERGWICFGCGRGGTIIDFGSHLYGIEPRGRGFHEIVERLEYDLRRAVAVAA